MQPSLRTVALATGVTLSYAEHGDPAGLPVVALHGVTDSWRSFEPLLPHLPRSLRLLALSQRGHGDSQRPASGYRTCDLAADAAAFIKALGIERALVVGHSMGSVNAMRLAIDHPERVLGLVLAGATPAFARNPDLVAYWRDEISALVDPIDPGFVRDFQQSTLAQPVPAAFVEMVIGESLKLPARVWRAAFDGLMSDDSASQLGAIEVPTLIVWGRHDAYCRRADQEALLTAIAGSRMIEYEAAGHAMHWEEPQRFARDLAAFASSVAALPSALAA